MLPTEEELKALPLRAIVALAARCARRLQPLFNLRHQRIIRASDAAIGAAEEVASGKRVDHADRLAKAAGETDDLTRYAPLGAAEAARSGDENGFDALARAADAITNAASVAHIVSLLDISVALARATYGSPDGFLHPDIYSHLTHVAHAGAESAVDATAYLQAADALAAATRADYERLRSTSSQACPKMGDPIDLGPKGPLGKPWPDGPPHGWPAALDRVAKEIAKSGYGSDFALPTEEEYKVLPLRAIVTLAARCARRVQPLFTSRHTGFIRDVDAAIAVAEEVASGKSVVRADRLAGAAGDATCLANDSSWEAKEAARSEDDNCFDAAASAAGTATVAASAGKFVSLMEVSEALARSQVGPTADLLNRDLYSHFTDMANRAAESSVEAAAYVQAADAAAAATRADYERLRATSSRAFPDLGDPIDPGENGPLGKLWPDGPPGGWQTALERVAEEIAKSPHEGDLPDITEDPDDPATKVYHRLKAVMEEALSGGGYEVFEEWNWWLAREICYVGPKKAIRLVWDVRDRDFTLERCGAIHNYPDNKWRKLKLENFGWSSEDEQRVLASITRSIRAFARRPSHGSKKG